MVYLALWARPSLVLLGHPLSLGLCGPGLEVQLLFPKFGVGAFTRM